MPIRAPDFSLTVGIEGVAPPPCPEAALPAQSSLLPAGIPALAVPRAFPLLEAPSAWDAGLRAFVTPTQLDRALMLPGELAARLHKAGLLTREARSPQLRALRDMLDDSALLNNLLRRGCSLLLRG